MAATDSAPAVDPVPAPEPVEDVKADDKPAKVTKEKKTKSPKEKKAKMAKSPKAPASHPSYLLVSSIHMQWRRKPSTLRVVW